MASNPFAGFAGRVSQFRQAFGNTRTVDPKLVPLVAGVGLGVLLVCALVGVLTGYPVLGTVAGVSLGLSGALLVFGQRASRAAIGSIEGRPGAAAAVLQSMRGPWLVTPAVAFTRKQEFVHRVVGRPGIILVGEGSPARVAALLRQEKRRVARVAGETAPIMFTAAYAMRDEMPWQVSRVTDFFFQGVMALPYHIYVVSSKIPQNEYTERVQYGAAFVFLALVMLIALTSMVLRERSRNRLSW